MSEPVKMYPEFEFIDTHAHLYLPEFDEDRDVVIQGALEEGVKHIYLPNIDSSSIESMLRLESDNPGVCYPMMGLHPCSVTANFEQEMGMVESWLGRHTFHAIGEIGTDLYWDKTYLEQQVLCFTRQIELAKEYNLPIVMHSRESLDLNIEIISQQQDGSLCGIFHCFTGTVEQARKIIDMGFYLGIGGVLTFKNSGLTKVVKELPLESLVLETDAPYLSPHPHRGKRNESRFIPLIAETLSSCMEVSLQKVSQVTTQNASEIFGIGR